MDPKIIELKQVPVVLMELEERPTKVEDSFANGFIYTDEKGYVESFYLDDICKDSKLVGILSDLTEEQFAECVPKEMYSHITNPKAIWYEAYFHELLKSENVYTENPYGEMPDIDDRKYVFEDHPELVGNPKEYDHELFTKDFDEWEEAQSRTIDPKRTVVLLRKEGDEMKRKNRGGRPGKPIHVYDEKYNYPYSFANQSEAFKYYNLKKGNLFGGKIFRLMPDGHYITKERLGRLGLARAVNIDSCKFCKTFPSDKPVEIYNRVGEKIGEFRSFRELAEITRIPYNTIIRYYRDDVKNGGVRESIDRPLRIKLKN